MTCESCGSTSFSLKVLLSPSILLFFAATLLTTLGMIFIVLPMQRMCLEKLSPPDSVVLPFAGENSFFINRDGSVGMNTTTVVKYSEETHFTTTKNVSSVAEVIVKTTKTVEKVEFIKKSNITIQASNNLFSLLALIKKSSSKVKSLTSFGQISVNMVENIIKI